MRQSNAEKVLPLPPGYTEQGVEEAVGVAEANVTKDLLEVTEEVKETEETEDADGLVEGLRQTDETVTGTIAEDVDAQMDCQTLPQTAGEVEAEETIGSTASSSTPKSGAF